MTGEPVVQVRAVSRSYRRGPEEVRAVDGVSLSLHAGELVALVGPSGSGKTTLLNLLVGWDEPDAGQVLWGRAAPTTEWERAAVVPQRLALLGELTVGENVELPLRIRHGGRPPRRPVTQVLDELGLTALADRFPDEVSLGEQQRTALARALVAGPQALVADEPTGHQDEAWVDRVLAVLRSHTDGGTAVLVASHDPAVRAAADRVVELRDGRVLTGGP